MYRFNLRLALAAAATAMAVVPATAGAARPSAERYLNASSANGVFVKTTPRRIGTLNFYCRNDRYESETRYHEYRESRYEVRDYVRVRLDGSFSYRGRANRYGAEGQWLGHFKLSLSGRFTSPTRVKIKRTLSDCGTATVAASAQR